MIARRLVASIGAIASTLMFVVTFAAPAEARAPLQTDGCDGSSPYKTLTKMRNFFNGDTLKLRGWGNDPQYRLTGNLYYWYCKDSRTEIDDKIKPYARGFCATKLDSHEVWAGAPLQALSFDFRVQNLNKNTEYGIIEIDNWDGNGPKDKRVCTGASLVAPENQEWYPINKANGWPYWRVWGTAYIGNGQPDKDIDFRDVETDLYIRYLFPWRDYLLDS